ncbi:trypsin-like serine protease [Catenulispora yoronensis]
MKNGNGTVAVGTVTANRQVNDSELITVAAGSAAGTSTFFGGVGNAGAAETTQVVRVAVANVRNTSACTSGASTGENCGLNIDATNVVIRSRARVNGVIVVAVVRSDMVIASAAAGKRSSGDGDSGGPVTSDSSNNRRAQGTISAGRVVVGCGAFARREEVLQPGALRRPEDAPGRIQGGHEVAAAPDGDQAEAPGHR